MTFVSWFAKRKDGAKIHSDKSLYWVSSSKFSESRPFRDKTGAHFDAPPHLLPKASVFSIHKSNNIDYSFD
jgi:hypothetical protein